MGLIRLEFWSLPGLIRLIFGREQQIGQRTLLYTGMTRRYEGFGCTMIDLGETWTYTPL